MVSLLLLLAGCSPTTVADASPPEEPRTDDTPAATCDVTAALELVPLDPWGRDLDVTVTWDAAPTTARADSDGPGVVRVPFGSAPFRLRARLEAEDHLPATLTAQWDGTAFQLSADGAVGRVTGVEDRVADGLGCNPAPRIPVTTAYVLLDHTWLAAAGRAPSHNAVELYTDGETHWEAVAEDLAAVEERVTWSTWWWESSFELLRDDDADVRAAHTIGALFSALPQAERRVLINRFWDDNVDWNVYLNSDADLRAAAETAGDGFDVILQGNPTAVPVYDEYSVTAAPFDAVARVRANPRYADRPLDSDAQRRAVDLTLEAASWHQKAMVFDGRVAWVTGMNTKQTDWDAAEHAVFDPRRMDPDAEDDTRAEVRDEALLPDNEPRKDYGVRLEGPAARDVEDVLLERWDAARADGAMYADRAAPFTLDDAPAAVDGAPLVQVVATMPEPWADQSIFETHAKAVRNAKEYIFIEDQYFRAPRLTEVLVQAMDADPDLVLIVVTQPVSDTDGGAKYTYLSDAIFRARYPDRYQLLQLASAELTVEEGWVWDDAVVEVAPIFVHSKLRIVDDRYLSVGSCNMNNRGYLYEGELNVAVLDEAFASDARRRIFAHLVGPAWSDLLTDDARNNFDVLAMAAEANAETLAWWEAYAEDFDDADDAEAAWSASHPSGFVYPLQIGDGYWWDVGPDAF